MKELTIEQKAQRYDEVVERAKTEKEKSRNLGLLEFIDENFPELRESEDEKIRKWLIALIRSNEYGSISDVGVMPCPKPRVLAWLEKQGEQKPTLPKWKYKKDNTPLSKDSLILNKYGCVAKSPSGALVSDVWVIDYDELAKLPKEEIEK